MKSVKLFSDGSCLGNPGAGGWAYILQYGDAIKKASGAEAMTTNNQMELTAAIMGLSALKQPCRVELFTDSEYVVKAISSWLAKWVVTDFKGKKKRRSVAQIPCGGGASRDQGLLGQGTCGSSAK